MQRGLEAYGWKHSRGKGREHAVEDVEGCWNGPPTYELPFPQLSWLHQIWEVHNDLLFLVDLTGSSRNSRMSCRIPSMASNQVVERWLYNVTRTRSSRCSVFFIPSDSRTTRRGNKSVTKLLQFCHTLRSLFKIGAYHANLYTPRASPLRLVLAKPSYRFGAHRSYRTHTAGECWRKGCERCFV